MSLSSLVSLLSLYLILLIDVQVQCSCFGSSLAAPPPKTPLQVTRCGRSPQSYFHLIPAALYSNGIQHFIRPLTFVQPQQIDVKRPTRQQQSAVVQQVTINQNTAFHSGLPSFGSFGGFKHPFSSPHHHTQHNFGGFRGRSYEATSDESLTTSRCPLNYVISCQPTVTEAPCEPNKSCY